jgi:hypothetical protein
MGEFLNLLDRPQKYGHCVIMDRDQAIDVIRENIEHIRSLGIVSIGIFGSTVRNQSTSASDVDVLVEYAPGALNFDSYMDLKFFLEECLHSRVDLVTMSSIKPALKKRILNEVVYAA